MRTVLYAAVGGAIVLAVVNCAIALLNQPSDLAVGAGYVLLLALVAAVAGTATRIWRRL